MAGSATLGANLLDRLIPLADSLRGPLHASFGVRQFRVYLVRRRWSGDRRGDGTLSILSETELLPAPDVDVGKLRHKLSDIGMEEDGTVVLREVSLTYTEAELTGQPIGLTEEFFYRIVDSKGQGVESRTFVPAMNKRPIADRTNTIGWVVTLTDAHFDPDSA